jgi:hypothetical protein
VAVVTGEVNRYAGKAAAAATVLIAKYGSAEKGGGLLKNHVMVYQDTYVFGLGILNASMVEFPDKYYSIALAWPETN